MKRYVIAAVSIGIVMFFSLHQWGSKLRIQHPDSGARHDITIRHDASNSPPGSNAPLRTKSNPRPVVPKSSVEETTRRLKETVLKRFTNEADITVVEFVTAINEAIEAAGVAPHELRISVNRADHVATWRIRDSLELANITVHNALNAHFGRTKITYKPREGGRVDLVDITQEPPNGPEPSKMTTPPSGQTDIFGNDTHAPDEPDPFADPVHPQ